GVLAATSVVLWLAVASVAACAADTSWESLMAGRRSWIDQSVRANLSHLEQQGLESITTGRLGSQHFKSFPRTNCPVCSVSSHVKPAGSRQSSDCNDLLQTSPRQL